MADPTAPEPILPSQAQPPGEGRRAPKRTPPDDTTEVMVPLTVTTRGMPSGRRAAVAAHVDGWLTEWLSTVTLVDDETGITYTLVAEGSAPPEEPATTEDRYWQAEAQKARAERDALALRLLQMADAWQERFAETGIRVDVAADAVRAAVENMGGR